MFIRSVLDWFRVKDYDAAKTKSAAEVAARYSRGNVNVQNGWFINAEQLGQLSASADLAMKNIDKKIASH
jgi:hypothetical protein